MEGREKKGIRIPVGIFIMMILVIIALLGVIIWGVVNDMSKEGNDNTTNDKMKENTSNVVGNEVDEDEDNELEELSLDDEIVEELKEKIAFPEYAVASLYVNGDITVDDMENDMILRLAWSTIDYDDKEIIEGDNDLEQHVKKDTVKKAIKELFGKNIKYTDETFKPIDVTEFHTYGETTGEIEFIDDEYVGEYFQGGGGVTPFISQEVVSAKKSDDIVELCVKVVFVDIDFDDEDTNYILYKDYKNGKFIEKIDEMSGEEFDEDLEGEGGCFVTNSPIADYSDELNTYKYTFKVESGKYYLYSVEKVEE